MDFVLELWYNLEPGKPLQNPLSDYWMVVSISNYQTNQVGIIQNTLMDKNLERDVYGD